MKPKGPWSSELVSTLRKLAKEGLSVKELAKQMGFPEHVIRWQVKRHKITVYRAATRRVLRGAGKDRMQGMIGAEVAARTGGTDFSKPKAGALDPHADDGKPRVREIPSGGCNWPIGHPNKPDFGFCPERAISGKPYCEAHQSLSKARVRGGDVTV